MREAQQEIKSTVSVNTSEVVAKQNQDKDIGFDKLTRNSGGTTIYSYILNHIVFFHSKIFQAVLKQY